MGRTNSEPPNKAMKLTSPEHIEGLQLIAGVRQTQRTRYDRQVTTGCAARWRGTHHE